MRQFTSAVLLLMIGQVALSQEVVDEDAEEPVVTLSEAYDVQLYATSPDGDSTGLIRFEVSDERVHMGTGEFEFTESSESFIGSWFGVSWGPLTYRFGGAASEAGDNLMLSSLAFGQVLTGRAFTLGSDSYEHFFVFGMMTDDLASLEEEDPPSDDVEGDEPVDDIPAEELTDEELAVDAGAS